MGNFNFKSVGKTTEQTTISSETVTSTPTLFGIKTPLRSDTKYIFAVTTSLKEQIADNFRNLLLTNWGERVVLKNYGANLRPLLTEYVSLNDFDSMAQNNISSAVSTWMPYIVLNNYLSSIDKIQTNGKVLAIKLIVSYDVPTLNIKDAIIEIILYVP